MLTATTTDFLSMVTTEIDYMTIFGFDIKIRSQYGKNETNINNNSYIIEAKDNQGVCTPS